MHVHHFTLHSQNPIHSKVQTDSKNNMVSQHSNLTFQCTPHNALQSHAPTPRLQQAFLIQMLHQQERKKDFVRSCTVQIPSRLGNKVES
jgi:hypothetical protein